MELFYCSECLMLNTRPRLTFDSNRVCSACQWAKEKKEEVNWESRQKELSDLCEFYKERNKGRFNCILPVSGGKDSSYVAHQMKFEWGMTALAVTVHPPLSYNVGNQNLENFINCGFDHIRITPNYEVGRLMAKKFFIEQGQPLLAWIMCVQTAIFNAAVIFDIPFVMFGEEGEVEYGGDTKLKNQACYNLEDSIKFYLSGNDPSEILNEYNDAETFWWKYPSEADFRKLKPAIAKYSYFKNWDSYSNYLYSKEHCGLEENSERCIGTYNNFAQTDTKLYDLHAYLMYLKFGFGRCTQDVGIDIRRGALSRKQGIALVKAYDGEYPEELIPEFLDYFRMTQEEFDEVLAKHANKDLFELIDGRWNPKFLVV